MQRVLYLAFVVCVLVTACSAEATLTPAPIVQPAQTFPALAAATAAQPTATPKPRIFSPITPLPTATTTASSTSNSASQLPGRNPTNWKTWSVIPDVIDPSLQKVYERGLKLGNDPRAFSIFGDCQARPADFFGVFETDTELVESLS